jgi:uncharacterized protein (DUF885 family)
MLGEVKLMRKIFNTFLYKSTALLLAAALLFSGLAGCSGTISTVDDATDIAAKAEESTDAKSLRENEGFEEFIDEIFKETLSSDGLAVHSYLEHPENYGLTDYSNSLYGYDLDSLGDTSELTETLVKLKSFDRELLTEKHKLTYDQLLYILEKELEYSDLYLYDTVLSTTLGEQIQLPLVMAEYAFYEEKDVEEYLSILESVDEYFSNIIEFEKLRAEAGIFMEDYLADEIIGQCETFIASASDGFLVSTFQSKLDGLGVDETKRENYIARNQKAIDEHVIKGYKILCEGIENLKGSGKYSGGICNYPDGRRYYEYYLAMNVGWSKSLDEFMELLSDYTNATLARMAEIATDYPDSYAKYSTFSFQDLTPTETLEQLKELIKDDYPDGPEINYSIDYVDKSISESASPAFYFITQIDNLTENSIYINPDNSGTADIYATLAHEGFPGHMYQTTYFAASDPDLIRYIIAPTGYVEGWGTYAEVDSYRYAETGDEYLNELMGLNYALTLLIYATVDMGVGCYGWDEDEVYEYITSMGFRGRRIAKEMYDSMVSEPGNYSRYVLGYIAILELRDKAKELLGDKYSTKEFNKFVLDTGAIQFDILFERIDEWASTAD